MGQEYTIKSVLLFLSICVCALAPLQVLASDKADLEARGLKKVSGADILGIRSEKKCTTISYDDQGKTLAESINVYHSDGVVLKTQGAEERKRSWSMEGEAYCETLFSSADKKWCGAHKIYHLLDGKLYAFHKNGEMQFEESCE